MSLVTNVIFKVACGDEDKIVKLNGLFKSGVEFKSCDDVEGGGWYAGSRRLECYIYPGAFNYLVMEDLVDAINKIEWEYPECVQLLAQGQEDDKFEDIKLKV